MTVRFSSGFAVFCTGPIELFAAEFMDAAGASFETSRVVIMANDGGP